MAPLRSTRRKLRRFSRLDGRRRALVTEAALWLLAARAALIVVPFRHIAQRLGEFVPPTDERVRLQSQDGSREEIKSAEDIAWAVSRAAKHVPFRAVCLPQAIAAKAMLNRRRVASVIHFGAARGADPKAPLEAHAWLDAAGIEVTGYPVAHTFTEIASFV